MKEWTLTLRKPNPNPPNSDPRTSPDPKPKVGLKQNMISDARIAFILTFLPVTEDENKEAFYSRLVPLFNTQALPITSLSP